MTRQHHTPAWAARLAAAQCDTHETIGGVEYARRPYGNEFPDVDMADQCHDCGTDHGQLHVVGCVVERCPVCGGQAIVCSCPEASESPVQ